MTFTFLYWLVVVVGLVYYVKKRDKDTTEWLAQHLAQAEEAFRKIQVNSSSPHLVLNGETAEVMQDKPGATANGNLYLLEYVLHRVVRNGSGEYFWMHYDSAGEPKVVVKHMQHSIARAILKEKYIAPATPSIYP